MSADDFQTKYSSVMESMLKSAVAETTKLFESMVDELKAEILKLKKENEALRSKYSQFENSEKQVPLHTGASETPPGKSRDKRDRATQCDIVPLRTMQVEECEPLKESSLQNLHEQWLIEDLEYDVQKHNYVSPREADSQMVYIQVKKEHDDCSIQQLLKEEEGLGSLPTSACGTENNKTHINQEFSTERIPLPHSNKEAAMALELSSSQMASGLQVQDPSSEAQHLLVGSLAAVKENLEEESEMTVNISKIGTELSISVQHPSVDQQPIENDQTSVLPQHCHREGERPVNKQTGVAVKKLADSTSCYTHVENEPRKTSMTEGNSSHQLVHHKRGKPPNGGKHVQEVVMEQRIVTSPSVGVEDVQVSSAIDAINTTVSKSLKVCKVKSKKALSIVTRSAQRRVNVASEENVDSSEVGTFSVSQVFIRNECSTNKEETSASQQRSMGKKEKFQAPSKNVFYATETNTLQTPFLKPTPCPTSVNIQDAMLLVEAMNQSSVGNNSSCPQTLAAAPQTKCGHLVGKLQTLDNNTNMFPKAGGPILGKLSITDMSTSNLSKVETPKDTSNIIDSALHKESEAQLKGHIPNPQHVPVCNYITTLPVPFSKAANQTSIKSLQQFAVDSLSVAPSKSKNSTSQKIIVVPRSTSLILPHKVTALSSSQLSSVVTTLVTARKTNLLPTSTAAKTSNETPSLSPIPQETIYVTFPSHSPVTLRDQQRERLPLSKLKIINPKQFQPQSCVLTTKQDSATPTSNVQAQTHSPVLALHSFGSLSQELKDSLKAKTTSNVVTLISKENYKTSDNLESPKQTSTVLVKENGHGTCSISDKPNGQAVESVSSVKQPRVEQTFSAMVRLTRLPFPLSNHESVLVSKLILDGSSKPQSVLKESNMPTHSSGMPQLSTDICQSLKETPVVPVKSCNEEVTFVLEMASASSKTSIFEDSQDNSCLQKFISSSVSAPSISMTESTADKPLSNQDKEKHKDAVQHCSLPSYQQNTDTSNDPSDPHLQMSKTQFLAQLAVSPIQEPEKVSNNDQSGGTISVESLNTTSLVARLRHHIRVHLQVRRPEANSEPNMETDATTAILKQPLPFSPNSGPSTKNTNSHSESPTRKVSSTDSISPGNTKSTSVSPSSKNISKGASQNTISTCVTPKMVITDRDVASLKKTKFSFVSPKSTSSAQDGTSENTSSTGVSIKRTNSTTETSSPQKTKCSSVSPKMSKNKGERMIGNFRRSSFLKVNPSTKPITRESNSLNTRRFSATTDSALSKKARTETVPPSSSILGRDSVRSMRTRISTAAKKPKLSPDGIGSKNNLRAANAKKLAIDAKAKKIAKMRNSKQQPLQNGSKISQVSGNQANSEAVKKITCKAVWIPPKMPIVKTPKKERRSLDFTAVYPPDNSVHSIPVKAPPVVSPLQPLLVIGGHLLKNQCGECGRILSSSAALESHVGLHTGRRPFSCTLCGKSFPDSKGLKRHGRVHRNGRIHVCPQCGKGFVYRFGLNKHLQMVHGKLKPFVCQICNKGFYTKRDVEAHIRIHTGEKPFHCNLCEKKFTRRVELNVHLRWHNGEKRHWCPYCGKGFLDFNNLKRHKYIHTGEKPHSCPHCPKRFTQSGHLKKHVKNVHKIE